MTWPSTTVPATAPSTHGEVRSQAYQAGGGDYFRSGYYSHGLFASAATSTTVPTLNDLHVRPFLVPVRRAFDRIGVNVTGAAAAGGVLRFGIYADGGGVPGSLLVDAGTVSSTSTGAREVTISQTLNPGVWWLAAVTQTASCSMTSYASATTTPWQSRYTTPPSFTTTNTYVLPSVSGALPASPTASSWTNANPMLAVCLRAA